MKQILVKKKKNLVLTKAVEEDKKKKHFLELERHGQSGDWVGLEAKL